MQHHKQKTIIEAGIPVKIKIHNDVFNDTPIYRAELGHFVAYAKDPKKAAQGVIKMAMANGTY